MRASPGTEPARLTRIGASAALALALAACGGDIAVPSGSEHGHSPGPGASASVAESPAPHVWEQVDIFGRERGWDFATSIAYGNAGFVALGERYEPADTGFVAGEPYLWASADGTEWEPVALPGGLIGDAPLMLLPAVDGGYVLVSSHADPEGGGWRPVVLSSADGRIWEAVDHGLPAGSMVSSAVRGGLGYVLITSPERAPAAIWFSEDGLRWEETVRVAKAEPDVQLTAIAASNEGFLALGFERGAGPQSWEWFAMVSGEGRDWVHVPDPFGLGPLEFPQLAGVAALGGDWIVTTAKADGSAEFWRSPDGESWESVSGIRGVGANETWIPVLEEAGGYLFFSANGRVIPTPGMWTSTDAAAWETVDVGARAVVRDVAIGGDAIVMVGSSQVEGGEWRATVWRSRHEH